TGTNLSGATAVTFGATAATGYTINSATQITATAPAGTGTVDVRVTTTGGTSATSAADQFSYQTKPIASNSTASVAYGSSANPINLTLSGSAATSVAVVTAAIHGTATVSGTTISYTPTAGYAGSDSFGYTASNGNGTSAQATVTITVSVPSVSLTPATLSNPAVGTPYSATITAAGGAAPYTYSVSSGSLPAGLSLNASTGVLSGTATVAGSFTFSLRGSDSSTGASAPFITSNSYTVTIAAPTITVTPVSLPAGTAATAYSQQLTGNGGVAPYVFTVKSGSLPAGLTLSSSGLLSGTPTAAGSFMLTVQAQDVHLFTGTRSYTLVVSSATVSLTPTSLPNPVGGAAYSVTLSADGGTGPYAYSVSSGSLPAGLSLNTATGLLSGTTTAVGSSTFSLMATDSSTGVGAPFRATNSYTLTVNAPTIVVAPTALAAMTTGSAYSQVITASGGTAPYSYAVTAGALPPGMNLAVGGTLSGTPTTAGAYSFTVTATDSSAFKGVFLYSGTVKANPPVTVADTATTNANTMVAVPVTSNDTGAITSIAIVTPPSHGTAKVTALNVEYTPASNFFGVDTLTYTATGPGGISAAATVTITVTPLAVPVAKPQQLKVLAGQSVMLNAVLGATGGPFTAVTLVTAPAKGKTIVSGTDITFTPDADGSGDVTLVYTVSNVFGASPPVTSTITVNPVPVAPALSANAAAGTQVDIDLTATATGGPFTGSAVLAVTPINAGVATIRSVAAASGSAGAGYVMTFKASATYSGTAVIGYTLSNAFASSPAGQVSVSVAARRDVSTDAEVAGLLAAQANTARRFASAQIGNFTRRLESLHGDGWGRSDFGLTLSTGNNRAMSDAAMSGYAGEDRIVGMDPRNGLSRNGMRKVGWKPDSQGAGNAGQGVYLSDRGADTQGPDLPGNDQPQGVQKQALAFWIGGAVDYGRQNLRGVDTQYRFTTSGISAGGDYRINDLATLGVGVGFSKDSSRIGVNGSKSSADSASAVIYGSLRPAKGVFIDGLLGYGSLSFDSTRYITDGGGTATGTRKGSQFFGSVIAGMEFYGSSWMWSPYGRLEMSQATLDTFTESAQGIQALTYFKQKVRSTNGVLGIRGEGMYSTAWGKLMPRARIEYTRRFQGDDEARMAYADLADLGPAYVLRTRGSDVGIWTVGLGGRLMLQSGVELSLEINSSLDTSNTRYRALSLGVRAPF
ncbi:putative Ig domain-containing protein, partial [Comamonas suwonensis]|uniref:putative Ig domain-containing protein n=1 Tax=Comamonas suwonensis TaxID=2606214 RepID=UPI001A7EF183